ncbi:MAG: hypothetical protein ABFS42_16940, partial [Candidatus Krumholzibacteriota bacterium]
NERDAWVADAQRWICQIKGVLQCKIDLDAAGEITGVHVVADLEREPRHIVRDVESLLKARLQMDVYYKKIGVVQVMGNSGSAPEETPAATKVEVVGAGVAGPSGVTFHPPGGNTDDDALAKLVDAGPPGSAVGTLPAPDPAPVSMADTASAPAAESVSESAPESAAPTTAPAAAIPAILVAEGLAPRIICSGVGVMASDMVVRAEVQLLAGEVEARGTREGPNHADADVQLVARATLDAVTELLVEPVLLHLNEIRITDLGGQSVVTTAVDLVEGRHSETLFGTCSTRHNHQQAVVHAVLDSLNRRLSMYSLKTASARD